jgi:hypothetical protein
VGAGSREPEVRSQKTDDGRWKVEDGSQKSEAGSRKPEAGIEGNGHFHVRTVPMSAIEVTENRDRGKDHSKGINARSNFQSSVCGMNNS